MKLALSLALLVPALAMAQTPAAAPPTTTPAAAAQKPLPAAATVLAKYREAMGSKAWLAAEGVTTSGIFEMPAAGMKASFELVQLPPNRMKLTMNVPGMGAIESGYDGTTAWAMDPMQGPRVLAGRELDQLRDESDRRSSIRDTSLYSAMKTLADTTMGTERCYLLQLTWKSGRVTNECYSTTTGLLVGTQTEQQTSMGPMTVTSFVSDYKKFGGVMIPTRTTQEMMGQQQIMTITDVKFGKPANGVVAPDAIKALKTGATPAPTPPPSKP